jgi:outer membrane protein TolC
MAVRAGESGVRAARAGYFPRVSAVARWGGVSADDPFADDNFDEAGSLGLQLQWPLFDGMLTRSRAAAARADLERQRWLTRAMERDAALEVRQALLSIRSARELIASEGANLAEAAEALRLAETRLAAGAGTALDVQDARTALEQARLGHARALYQYSVGRLDLQRATGTITEEDAP